MKIPFYKPPISFWEYIEVFKTLRSGWLTTGKKNKEFSLLLSEYLGIEERYLKLVASCTAGLHLLFDAFEVRGCEILIPAITFISPVEMAILSGAKPVIVDVEDEYITISPDDLERKITSKSKVVVPTYYGGNPYDVEQVVEISRAKNLVIIEDAAHGFGAEYKGYKVGNISKFGVDATVFSFYATKTLQTGEGGAIVTSNERVLEKISKTYLHGMDRDAWKRYHENVYFYDITEFGFKYNFPDILASIGIAQIKRFDDLQKKREKIWKMYIEYLRDIEGIKLPKVRSNSIHSYHLFVIRLRLDMWKIDRNKFIALLSERGIGTSVHFTPVYRFSRYKSLFDIRGFPNSEKVFQEIVSIPFYPDLKKKEVEYICDSIRDLWNKYRR